MKTNKITLIILFVFFTSGSFAQSDSLINECIRSKVNLFFNQIKRFELEKSNSINILEIVNNKPLEFNEVGIYSCSDYGSQHQKYLMLRSGNKTKILSSNNSSQIIKEVSSFLIQMKISDLESIKYIKASIVIIEENSSKIIDDVEKKEKWTICK